MNALVLLALALAPGACVIVYIYLKDKHEREPVSLLIRSFLYGVLSIVVTFILSIPLEQFVPMSERDLTGQALHAFIIVALVEEFSKFLFVRWVLFHDTRFNEPFDGIVYSVMVGMGFATLENILYVAEGGFGTAVLRMFTAVPAHATFAVLMGFYIGKEKFERRPYLSWFGLLAATFFHGAYDYCWFVAYIPGIWLGAIASLVVGLILSRKAIQIHQDASPFRNDPPPAAAE